MIKGYYHNRFRSDLTKFMPDGKVPYFGHSWDYDCHGLKKIQLETRPSFLICLYFTVLVDQTMYTYYNPSYKHFAELTKYPKFCHGLGQFQKNPRDLLYVPIQKRFVSKNALENELPEGMELFVDEVLDFLKNYMTNIDPVEFFDNLMYDSDVQIPLLIVMVNPEMKDDIVVKAYELLRTAVENKINKKD